MKKIEKRLKSRMSSETYQDWEKTVGIESAPGVAATKEPSRRPRHHWSIFAAAALCAVVVSVGLFSVFTAYQKFDYGIDDLTITSCISDFLLGYLPINTDGLEDVDFKKGVITKTAELSWLNMIAVCDEEELYAEIEITAILIDNLTISKDSSVSKCNIPYSVNGFEFKYVLEGKDSLLLPYLAYAKRDGIRYYVSIYTIKEVQIEILLSRLFS